MKQLHDSASFFRRAPLVPALAAATFLFHVVANPHYGFFRDELYFIVCGRHPAFGYVDQPPLVPLAAALSQVFGTSLALLRSISALCAGISVFAAGALALEFGGGAFAVLVAAIATALAPVLAAFGTQVGPDSFTLWTWPLATLLVARAVRGGRIGDWIWAGVVVGIAAEGKYSVLFFAVALVAGLLLTPQRRALASRGAVLGLLAAIVIALPSVLWQALHAFPMLELLRNGANGKNVVLSPAEYVVHQITLTGALLALVWIAGLVWAFRKARLRWLAWTYVTLLVMMIVLHAKDYYPLGVYPALFAAGAVALERISARWRALRVLLVATELVAGALLLPVAMPILPLATFVAYAHALPLPQEASEHNRVGALPQDFADMQGWPQMAAAVGRVVVSLPPEDRRRVVVVAGNYGEAGALDVFGPRYGVTRVVSGHNAYWTWGPGSLDRSIVVDVGESFDDRKLCGSATRAATFSNPLVMPYEDHLPIVVCRNLRISVAQLWPRLRLYI